MDLSDPQFAREPAAEAKDPPSSAPDELPAAPHSERAQAAPEESDPIDLAQPADIAQYVADEFASFLGSPLLGTPGPREARAIRKIIHIIAGGPPMRNFRDPPANAGEMWDRALRMATLLATSQKGAPLRIIFADMPDMMDAILAL